VALTRDRGQLNRQIRIHAHLFEVVGILPDDFGGLTPTEPATVIVPYSADHLFPNFQRNEWAECRIVVRLKDRATWDAARAEAEVIVAQELQANPPQDAYDAPAVQVGELSTYFSDLQRSVITPIRVLSATVALLLLITCANVGGLLFARGRARQKEMATRLALGGARRRVMQQLITESLVLCLTGGVGGVALAYAFNPLLPRFLGQLGGTTLGVTVRPDLGVLAFAVIVTLACGVLFGWLPALMATRVDPALSIKQASGLAPTSRLRAGKVALAIQLALSLIVLVAAGLLVRTMTNLRGVPLGYTPEGMVFVLTSNPVGRPRAFVEQTLAELEALPGVQSATVSQWPIFNNTTLRAQFCIPGGDPAVERLDLSYVFPRFFETWGVRLLRGHDIPDRGEPVAVVNETFARRFFPRQDPLGRVFMSGPCPGRTPLRIIGVAEDHIDRQRVELVPAVYLRYPLAGALYVTTYALRTNGDERALLPALRRIIADRGIAPDGDARTGIEHRESIVARERVMMLVLVVFAAVSLFISCLGVYGMLAYTVGWRTPEIGLRMAIGAARPEVLWLIVRESLMPVALGAALGIAASVALSRGVESFLFGVTANDPIALTVAVAMLVMAAGAAASLAAWRACRIEPVQALRCE
jgi:predicted permease